MEMVKPYPKASISILNNLNTAIKTHHSYKSCNFNIPTTKIKTIQQKPPLNKPILKKEPTRFISPQEKSTTTTITITAADVLRLFDALGLEVSTDIYISLMKECTETQDAAMAFEVHNHIELSGIIPSLQLQNRILLMYVSCSCMEIARHVFDEMSVKDSNSWAAMIAGYTDNDEFEEAIDLFLEMQKYHYGVNDILGFPGSWIHVCILKACEQIMNVEFGSQIHGRLLKLGCYKDLYLSSSLINFYGKVGCLEDADFVFEQMPGRGSTVIWTARIVNYCKEERFDDVINIFSKMGKEGVRRNSFTFSSVLKACANMRDDGYCGRQVHASVVKLGLESKRYVQSSLVNMYGKFGLLREARRVFEASGDDRNSACWSAMLTSYIRQGFCIEAIKILYNMKLTGLQTSESLLDEVKCVCGSISIESR